MAAGAGTILLVDDHDTLRLTMRAVLERAGCAVVEACNGMVALDVVAAWPIDLLVTDLSMPGLSGPELARSLAARRPGLPVLLISALDLTADDLAHALPPGGRYLRKPFTGEDLAVVVRDMLGRRTAPQDS